MLIKNNRIYAGHYVRFEIKRTGRVKCPVLYGFKRKMYGSVTDIAQAMRKIVQRNHEILFQKVIDSWKPD